MLLYNHFLFFLNIIIGKSTLLNYILKSDHGKRIAIIENEFSEGLGIETMIAKSGVDGNNITNFFELPNGCVCSTNVILFYVINY